MITTSGTIYFIGEIDVLSHKTSNYVKIGLVRTTDGTGARSAANRLYEHQGKQPRDLFIIDEVITDCVHTVEALIHTVLAKNKIRGEWFILTDDEVKIAIAKCRELANKFNQYSKVAIVADALTQCASSTETKKVNAEAISWANEYWKSSYIIKSSQRAREQIMDLVMDAVNNGIETRSVGMMKQRKISTFNNLGFQKKYPNLYNSYYKRSQIETRGMFNMVSRSKLDTDFDDRVSLVEFHFALAEAVNASKRYEANAINIADLKIPYLELTAYKKQAEADKEIAMDYLKSFCGTASGIEGICRWKRTEVSIFKLFKDDLKISHPDEYEEFMTLTSSPVFVIGASPSWEDVKYLGSFE